MKASSARQKALQQSAECFFNSLFREWNGFKTLNSPKTILQETACEKSFQLPLSGEVLWIPLQKKSLLGKHRYGEYFYQGEESLEKIDFISAAEKIVRFLIQENKGEAADAGIFISRLENSLHNMQEALAERQNDLSDIYKLKFDFKKSEQALMVGHNFHPYPKMREGFREKDYRKYSPEMAGSFSLNWFLVKPEVLLSVQAKEFKDHDWLTNLFLREYRDETQARTFLNPHYLPFPVHPWQRQHLLKNPVIQSYLEKGDLLDLGASEKIWSATSSLRSLYAEHAKYMLKFSLTLRLTNSIRHLTAVEVVRGQQVYDVFASPSGQEFLHKYPEFHVIAEPAFVALKDKEGNLLTESIVVCRENPFFQKNSESVCVLATLNQDPPVGQQNLIQKCILKAKESDPRSLPELCKSWFEKYLRVAVNPLLQAQCNYGILLGAHQQNLLLKIKDNFPEEAYFRDCQGTGYSEYGFSLLHSQIDSLKRENGNVLDHRGNYLFAYYLIINSTFNVIASLSADNWISEEDLLSVLRDFLMQIKKENPHDSSCLDYLLFEKEILQKGNFYCSLQNLNENTTANPLAIYNPIPNPLWRENV